MDKPFIELSPQELNSFLIEKYGFGLHPFAMILCFILFQGESYNYDYFLSSQLLLEFKKKLENLKKKIIDTILEFESTVLALPGFKAFYKRNKNKTEEYIIEQYKLDKFLVKIDDRIEVIETITKNRQRGPSIKKRNLIVSLWGYLIQEIGNKIEWDVIAELLDWFWDKLKHYNIYKDLSPKENYTDLEYLRNQFSRNKERSYQAFKLARKRVLSQDLLNPKEVLIFGRHYYTVIKYQDLPYFYKKNKKVFYASYKESKLRPLLPNMIKQIELQTKNKELLFTAFVFYASTIYKENPTYPHLIIFPDLSCLQ